MQVYPSWRYKPECEPKLCMRAEEDAVMAANGWVDTPAKFPPVPVKEPDPIKVEIVSKKAKKKATA